MPPILTTWLYEAIGASTSWRKWLWKNVIDCDLEWWISNDSGEDDNVDENSWRSVVVLVAADDPQRKKHKMTFLENENTSCK